LRKRQSANANGVLHFASELRQRRPETEEGEVLGPDDVDPRARQTLSGKNPMNVDANVPFAPASLPINHRVALFGKKMS